MSNDQRQHAATPNPPSDFNWKVDPNNDSVTIVRFLDDMAANVVIPDEIDSRPVARIGEGAFKNCYWLTSVAFPNGLKALDEYAFESCVRLTSVVLPESLESVDDGAFHGCKALTSVAIPNGIKNVAISAFYACEALSKFHLSPGPSRYRVVDGVLFADDGKTLVAFPRKK